MVRGAAVALTPTEWGVLTALATVPGRVYSRYELINRVRGYEFEGYERTIDSHVKNLRRKIERDPRNPRVIETVLGVGYRLGPPPGPWTCAAHPLLRRRPPAPTPHRPP